jgi:hypothetical protein
MMERFWIFLEAIAGLLERENAVEMLARDLSQMPQPSRERLKKLLSVVVEKLPDLASRLG